MNAFCFVSVKPDKLRFRAVAGLMSVFDIDIPVQNSQRQNALIAIRWQVRERISIRYESDG